MDEVGERYRDKISVKPWQKPREVVVKILMFIARAILLYFSARLRADVWNYRESGVSREISNFFIFYPSNLNSKVFSKITLKVSTAFYFVRNRAKFENTGYRPQGAFRVRPTPKIRQEFRSCTPSGRWGANARKMLRQPRPQFPLKIFTHSATRSKLNN